MQKARLGLDVTLGVSWKFKAVVGIILGENVKFSAVSV